MSVRRFLIPLALLAGASAAVLGCGDASPVGLGPQAPSLRKEGKGATWSRRPGLVSCTQAYDSVTQVIGPAGGMIAVGPHYLWVDSMALSDTVRITAVAPADTVRWIRFQPDGLQFRTNGAGRSAVLYTSYDDCVVPWDEGLRIAQVTGSLRILGYLQTYVQVRKNRSSPGRQYVAGVLHHFSQYAVSW
jgi:hypothetical protein